MLDHDTRTAVFRLREQGHGARAIARALGIARNSVRQVLQSGERQVPRLERCSQLDPQLDAVRSLHRRCRGNLVRVGELLEEQGIRVAYSTLTAFCRRHDIGGRPKRPAGRYHFDPGQEMQHDTSPHGVKVGGQHRKFQCASLVLCYSRMLYTQLYPRWSRFECRVFLSEALQYLGGAADRCMIDNSSVVIASGTGANAVPAAPMKALADRFDFHFRAHELGDANRSARVERPFHYIENNFYRGRRFESVADLNGQLREWCDKVNRKHKPSLKAKPIELFAAEYPALKRLPIHIPRVYDLHSRRVDVEGYVCLHRNRYSVPVALLGRTVEIRESIDRVRVFDGHRIVAQHERLDPGQGRRVCLPEHRLDARRHRKPAPPLPEERRLRAAAPELAALVDALRKRHGGQAARAVRRLHRFWQDYPLEPLRKAVGHAVHYGLLDLNRIEVMVLRNIAGDYFRLPANSEEDDDGR